MAIRNWQFSKHASFTISADTNSRQLVLATYRLKEFVIEMRISDSLDYWLSIDTDLIFK